MVTYVIGIPLIEGRYSVEWYNELQSYMFLNGRRKDIRYMGDHSLHKVKHSEFLNYTEYCKYTMRAMSQTLTHIEDGDSVLFFDGETPGLEAFEFVRKMEDKDITIKAVWLAGSHDETDLVSLRHVQSENLERDWFAITDKIFVASEFHKNMIVEKRNVPPEKVVVTGLPLAPIKKLKPDYTKQYDVLYGGRLSNDKGYDIVNYLRSKGIQVYATKEHELSKAEYYTKLYESSVVIAPSLHENFGYVPLEALIRGTPVLVPDRGVFKETIPVSYRYADESDLLEMLINKSYEKYVPPNLRAEIAKKYDPQTILARWLK